MHPAKLPSLRLLWDAADRLLGRAGLPMPQDRGLWDSDDGDFDSWDSDDSEDDDERARDKAWREVDLLADLANGVVPPPLVEELLPFDFGVPEAAAAYRLLVASDLDVGVARARATDPDVAGLLACVIDFADLRSDDGQGAATWALTSAWERRHLLVEADRLREEAARLAEDDALDHWEVFTAAGRVLDEHHDRLSEALTTVKPPVAVPRMVPSAYRRLLNDALEPGVPLDDEMIARTVVDLVRVADRRVLVAVPWIREDELAETFAAACIDRVRAGVRVLIVVRPVKPSRGFEEAARAEWTLHKRLTKAGVQVAYNGRLHDKLFVVDDTAVIGSMNLTRSDIRINRNSAVGLGLPMAVEHLAKRVESLASAPREKPAAPHVPDEALPVFGYCYDDLVHRLQVPATADLGALEGGTDVLAACGELVTVDSVSSAAALLGHERCGSRECNGPRAA